MSWIYYFICGILFVELISACSPYDPRPYEERHPYGPEHERTRTQRVTKTTQVTEPSTSSQYPETPQIPETPSTPKIPETTEMPQIPETQSTQEIQETPSTPHIPEISSTPQIQETTSAPQTQENPSTPQIQETSTMSVNQETTESSENQGRTDSSKNQEKGRTARSESQQTESPENQETTESSKNQDKPPNQETSGNEAMTLLGKDKYYLEHTLNPGSVITVEGKLKATYFDIILRHDSKTTGLHISVKTSLLEVGFNTRNEHQEQYIRRWQGIKTSFKFNIICGKYFYEVSLNDVFLIRLPYREPLSEQKYFQNLYEQAYNITIQQQC